jgi:hypothetical protein
MGAPAAPPFSTPPLFVTMPFAALLAPLTPRGIVRRICGSMGARLSPPLLIMLALVALAGALAAPPTPTATPVSFFRLRCTVPRPRPKFTYLNRLLGNHEMLDLFLAGALYYRGGFGAARPMPYRLGPVLRLFNRYLAELGRGTGIRRRR